MQNELKLGLALGSGGAYGFAFLGVLDELEKAKIKVSTISGSSMGAIIGALYAGGVTIEQMQKFCKKLKLINILDLSLGKLGLVKGDKAIRVIKKLMDQYGVPENIEKLKIKFGAVATDVYTAKSVYFTKGNVLQALRASFSIPGIFRPYELDGRLLVDGGPICRVPVRLAKKLGADVVVSLDCVGTNAKYTKEDLNTYSKLITRIMYIMDYNASKAEIEEADISINMHQPGVDPINLKNIEKSIEFGHKYGKQLVKMLKAKYQF